MDAQNLRNACNEQFQTQQNNMRLAQSMFAIEFMQGRPKAKFNLIIMNDKGNHFSSENNRLKLLKYIKNLNKKVIAITYLLLSKESQDKNRDNFYFLYNEGSDYSMHGMTIKNDEFYNWSENQ